MSPAEAAEAAAGFVGLLNGLLGSRRQLQDPRLVRRTCRQTVERYIERHLHRHELDTAALCRAFACSRSRLYDLFRTHGGVDRYLRERRLARCFRELADATESESRIGHVAARWGFHDKSHFNRLFKRHFGLRPSDVLASRTVGGHAPRPGSFGRDVDMFRAWFCSL